MITALTSRQLQFRFAVGFAFNAGLFIFWPMRGTGKLRHDLMVQLTAGLLATGAIVPAVALLRFGSWPYKIVGIGFLVLPARTFLRIAQWASAKW